MSLPTWLQEILPADTAYTWETIAPLVPRTAYLAGGTAVSVHLRHRVSRDLDFFYHQAAVDLDDLAGKLSEAGPFAIEQRRPGTLNGVFSQTKLQFLHADEGRRQTLLAEPTLVEGLYVAGLPDLMAMKLKVIIDRGELRDYYDIKEIEERAGLTVDQGLGSFLARYHPDDDRQQVLAIIRALGYLEDVDEDESLPLGKNEIERYWQPRQPELLKNASWISSGGTPPPPPLAAAPCLSTGPDGSSGTVRAHTRAGVKVRAYHRKRR